MGAVTNRVCTLCGRPMDMPGDELSLSCGEDCWGCVREIETSTPDSRPLKSEGAVQLELPLVTLIGFPREK